GEHHRDVDQHPAAVMDRGEPSASHGLRQFGGQPHLISEKAWRDGSGVGDHSDTVSSNGQTRRPRRTLHLPSAFCVGTWNLRQVPVSPVQEALRSIFARQSSDPRESPGLTKHSLSAGTSSPNQVRRRWLLTTTSTTSIDTASSTASTFIRCRHCVPSNRSERGETLYGAT